jgi:hypothetical protein
MCQAYPVSGEAANVTGATEPDSALPYSCSGVDLQHPALYHKQLNYKPDSCHWKDNNKNAYRPGPARTVRTEFVAQRLRLFSSTA